MAIYAMEEAMLISLTEQDIKSTANPEAFKNSVEAISKGVILVTNEKDYFNSKGGLLENTFSGFTEKSLKKGLKRIRKGEFNTPEFETEAVIIVIRRGNYGVSMETAEMLYSFTPHFINSPEWE